MKIKKIDESNIIFDDESYLTWDYKQDCCEYNYADFEQIEKSALNYDFDKDTFRLIPNDYGFRFGDKNRTFFIPCYSQQNGFYSSEVDIFYRDKDGNKILDLKKIDCYLYDFESEKRYFNKD